MTHVDYQPTKDDFGYWMHESDPIQYTLLMDARKLEQEQSDHPAFFQIRDKREPHPRMKELLDAVHERLGYDAGSYDMMAILDVAFKQDPWKPNWKRQPVGNCVGATAWRVGGLRMLHEVLVFGDTEELLGTQMIGQKTVFPFGPHLYGCGRRHGNMQSGDGSYCSVQVKAAREDGFLRCDTPGLSDIVGNNEQDYPECQNASMYRAWGNWRYLDQFAQAAAKNRMQESVAPSDADEVRRLLVEHHKPLAICSGWGFASSRSKAGDYTIYTRSGSWAHSMSVVGWIILGGNAYVKICNSWGNGAHTDGAAFLVPAELFDRWLKQAQCLSYGEIDLVDSGTLAA